MFDGPAFAEGTVVGNGDVRQVSYGADAGLFVEFRSEPFHNEVKSAQAGRAVYDEKVMVRIHVPGDKTKVVDREVRMQPEQGAPPDPQRWPAQWQAFEAGHEAMQSGTPLAEWPKITKQQVTELNSFKVFTVEQLSQVSDGVLDGLGHGARSLRDGAINWLARANDDAAVTRLEARHAAEMAEMQAQIAALRDSVTQPRGPGRPRKEETHDVQS